MTMDKVLDYVVKYLIRQCVITEEDEEIYFYSFKVVFLIGMTILLVLTASIYLKCLLESAIFLLFLAPLRTYAGGYHAESPWGCFVLYITLNFSAVAISRIIPEDGYFILMATALPLAMLVILFLAPVAAPRKPLLEYETKKYKRTSIIIGAFECVSLFILFAIVGTMPEIYLNGTLGVLIAAVSMIAEKIRINLGGGELSYEIKREL
jgi:accessory gene regulator B